MASIERGCCKSGNSFQSIYGEADGVPFKYKVVSSMHMWISSQLIGLEGCIHGWSWVWYFSSNLQLIGKYNGAVKVIYPCTIQQALAECMRKLGNTKETWKCNVVMRCFILSIQRSNQPQPIEVLCSAVVLKKFRGFTCQNHMIMRHAIVWDTDFDHLVFFNVDPIHGARAAVKF